MSLLIDALKKAERSRVMQHSANPNRDGLLTLSANELGGGSSPTRGGSEIEKNGLVDLVEGDPELTLPLKGTVSTVLNLHTASLPKDHDPLAFASESSAQYASSSHHASIELGNRTESASSILSQWGDPEQEFKPSPVDIDILNELPRTDGEKMPEEEGIELQSEVGRAAACALFIRKARRQRRRARMLYFRLPLVVVGFCAAGYLYWQLLELGVFIAPTDGSPALSEIRVIHPTLSIFPESENTLDIISDPLTTPDTSIDTSVTVARVSYPVDAETATSTEINSETSQSLASDIATLLPLRGDFTSGPTEEPAPGDELLVPPVVDELATSELTEDKAPTGHVSEVDSTVLPIPQVKITTRKGGNTVAQLISRAYQAYWRGEDTLAENSYREVLRREPKTREALLGLASLAMRRGDMATAMHHYQEILRLFPQDRVARRALLQKTDDHYAGLDKHQIKTLLQEFPDASYLNFSLGNLYAAQSQWSPARTAYLRALHVDSTNPDYAFNLAISLEHLHQPETALHFYKNALDFARSRPATFVRETAEHRVQILQNDLSREAAL